MIQAITQEPFNRGRDADNKLILNPATLAAITTVRDALDALQTYRAYAARAISDRNNRHCDFMR